MVAKVNADECVGCGACEDVCPQDAITVDDIAVIDADACVDCGACADECPNDAIEVD
jgi:ferredoxin